VRCSSPRSVAFVVVRVTGSVIAVSSFFVVALHPHG
jgi:hypothetical protein